jgi:ABC-type dipeptide/oligopeptide/nickel transport system ATPase component
MNNNIMEKIDELIVLALVGVSGRGKSTLGSILVSQIERLNCKNYDKRPVFETSRGLISMTQGVDCLDEMLKLPGTNKGLLILDVQGVDSILDKNENINNLNILKNFYIAMISSSIVMYL